jgi:hypothetical protein
MITWIVATIAGGIILTMLQALTGLVLGPLDLEVPPGMLTWVLVANVLHAGVLAWFARKSVWSGWRLAAALFVISYGTGHASSLIEAYVFDIFGRPGLLRDVFLHTLLPALLFPPVVVLLTGRWSRPAAAPSPAPARPTAGWLWRFAVCSVAYVLLYFAAGTIVFPFVQDFYAQLRLPSTITIILLQLFVRGPLFTAVGLLIVRMVPGTRVQHALMVAMVMAIAGGVIPLIAPNPLLPDHIRWAHLAEVVPSNFLFGCLVGWLFSQARD